MTDFWTPIEEAGLADQLLTQALEAFMATGDPVKVTIPAPDVAGPSEDVPQEVAHRWALLKRLEFARSSVLWAALAVEAAVNFYIGAVLPADAKALDRLETTNKLLIAPKLAGHNLFTRGTEPMGQLVTLFKLRNRIVHPKTGGDGPIAGEIALADFTPRIAADCLIGAARAIRSIRRALPDDVPFRVITVKSILRLESEMRDFSRRWTEQLPTPPPSLLDLLQNPPD